MIRQLSNLALCLGAGAIWLYGNILMGNLKALEWLGWMQAYPWYLSWIVAFLPSASQLYITEQLGSDDGEELDALSMVFAVFVAIVVDLGGPMLGFFVVSGLPFNMLTFVAALVVAVFASVLCQHVCFVRARALLGYAPKRKKQRAKAQEHPLMDRIKGKAKEHYPNGSQEHENVDSRR